MTFYFLKDSGESLGLARKRLVGILKKRVRSLQKLAFYLPKSPFLFRREPAPLGGGACRKIAYPPLRTTIYPYLSLLLLFPLLFFSPSLVGVKSFARSSVRWAAVEHRWGWGLPIRSPPLRRGKDSFRPALDLC